MWSAASRVLNRVSPRTHKACKQMLPSSFTLKSRLGLPRRIAGRLVWVQGRLLKTEPPEKHIVRWISEQLSRGQTFFDFGAHYGWMTLVAAHLVGRAGRVVVFEASPPLLEILGSS